MVRSEKDVFGNFFMKNNFYLVARKKVAETEENGGSVVMKIEFFFDKQTEVVKMK
jgi:hypothetical protein